MAKVKAKVDCFVANARKKAGEIFEYSGPENGNLIYLDSRSAAENKSPEVAKKPEAPATKAGKKAVPAKDDFLG